MSKTVALILIGAIPTAFALILALTVWIPRIGNQPSQDFLYLMTDFYSDQPQTDYSVINGKLQFTPRLDCGNPDANPDITYPQTGNLPMDKPNPNSCPNYTLYYHDVSDNQSRPLSLNQAQTYRLNPNPKSRDGFQFEVTRPNDQIFNFSSYDRQPVLYKNNLSYRQNFSQLNDSNRYQPILFLAWVEE